MNPQQLKLYAITDRSWLKPGETLTEVVETLLKAGVTCVQLREKEAEDAFILRSWSTTGLIWLRQWAQMGFMWVGRTPA